MVLIAYISVLRSLAVIAMGSFSEYRIWISERAFDRTVYGKRVVWTYPIILAKVIHKRILLGNACSRFDNGSNARFLLRRRGARFEIRQVAEGCYSHHDNKG